MSNESLYKWYVYQLINPRTNLVFYVGKGSKNRIDQHEAEARKGVCSKKCRLIRDIESSGLSINKEKIAYFSDEQLAYDFETDLIDNHGLDNLTNVMLGGQCAWEKRLKKRRAPKASFTPKRALDFVKKYADHYNIWFRYVYNQPNAPDFKISYNDTECKFSTQIYHAFTRAFAKMAFNKAAETKENRNVLKELFKRYEVIIDFGGYDGEQEAQACTN